jgi:hypothetical protein
MFDKILTPTGKPSSQAEGYANLLVAERLTGRSLGFEGNTHTQRGTEREPQARAYYEFIAGPVEEVGFCLHDLGHAGASPDGLVGEDGLLEIKCPSEAVHVEYLLAGKVATKYLSQVQGQLWVTGRKWCDWISFHPEMPPVLVRVKPDTKYQAALETEIAKFTALMAEKMKKLEKYL